MNRGRLLYTGPRSATVKIQREIKRKYRREKHKVLFFYGVVLACGILAVLYDIFEGDGLGLIRSFFFGVMIGGIGTSIMTALYTMMYLNTRYELKHGFRRFQVYEHGIVPVYVDSNMWRYKRKDFVYFGDMKDISFSDYGLTTYLIFGIGPFMRITHKYDTRGYLFLIQALTKQFPKTDFPDMKEIHHLFVMEEKLKKREITEKQYSEFRKEFEQINKRFYNINLISGWLKR